MQINGAKLPKLFHKQSGLQFRHSLEELLPETRTALTGEEFVIYAEGERYYELCQSPLDNILCF